VLALLFAARLCSQDAPQDLPISIGLAPTEALQRHTDFFRRAQESDERARKDWQNLSPGQRLSALKQILAYAQKSLRKAAVSELAALGASDDPSGNAVLSLVQAGIKDNDPDVRKAALGEVKAHFPENAPRLLAKQLRTAAPEERQRAEAALKEIGGERVVEAVIEQWREIWGPGPRAYFAVMRQQAYVADYDISGDTYDPVIRTVNSGVVLDVKPLMTYANIYIVRLLRDLTGKDLGNDPAAWDLWLVGEKARKAQQ
jgi:hypothetical protein